MDSYPIILSGSTHGAPIKVAATSTPGTTIHTATSSAGNPNYAMDLVTLYVSNTHTAAVNLTIEYGGTTDPDHLILDAVPIPINTRPIQICFDFPLRNGLVIKAFASTANVLLIYGPAVWRVA